MITMRCRQIDRLNTNTQRIRSTKDRMYKKSAVLTYQLWLNLGQSLIVNFTINCGGFNSFVHTQRWFRILIFGYSEDSPWLSHKWA